MKFVNFSPFRANTQCSRSYLHLSIPSYFSITNKQLLTRVTSCNSFQSSSFSFSLANNREKALKYLFIIIKNLSHGNIITMSIEIIELDHYLYTLL